MRIVIPSSTRGPRRSLPVAGMLLALLGVAAPPAWAAGGCDETSNAIAISETQQISYGTIAVTTGGGTVTISPSGAVSAPGGFTVSGVTSAGKFHVTGKQNCSVSISFLAGSLTGPGTAMAIGNFTDNAGANPSFSTTGGGSLGSLDFSVGADLTVNPSQAGGSYSGTYTVTVIY
jgi:Mat/Ecp fimbriae major subunit